MAESDDARLDRMERDWDLRADRMERNFAGRMDKFEDVLNTALREKLAGVELKIGLFAPDRYVTKEEFGPVKAIVYGMVAFILVGTLGALLALVVKQGGVVH